VDHFGSAYLGHSSRGIRVLARMALSPLALCKHYSHLARRQLSYRTVFDLDRAGLASRRVRRGIADSPYGSASAADDHRSSFDLGGRAPNANFAWSAAAICAIYSFSTTSLDPNAVDGTRPLPTGGLLAGCHGRIGGLAYSRGVYARFAI